MLWFILQIGVSIKPQDDTPLSDMLGMNLEKHLDELNAISAQVTYLLLYINKYLYSCYTLVWTLKGLANKISMKINVKYSIVNM